MNAVRDIARIARMAEGRRVVLGLAGPPGAGKSTLAETIVRNACDEMGEFWAACVPLDGFLLSNAQLERLGKAHRKGALDTYDVVGYAVTLRRIVEDSDEIYVPEYDMVLHEAIAARGIVLRSTRLIVTEGDYIALDTPEWSEPRRFIDHMWYVDADDALREERLLRRWIAGGRDERAAKLWIEENDRLNSAVVKPSKMNCARIITPV